MSPIPHTQADQTGSWNLTSTLAMVLGQQGGGWSQNIIPVPKSLHWLPICYQARFRILILIDKALNNLGPSKLRDHLSSNSLSIASGHNNQNWSSLTWSNFGIRLYESELFCLQHALQICYSRLLRVWEMYFSHPFPLCCPASRVRPAHSSGNERALYCNTRQGDRENMVLLHSYQVIWEAWKK